MNMSSMLCALARKQDRSPSIQAGGYFAIPLADTMLEFVNKRRAASPTLGSAVPPSAPNNTPDAAEAAARYDANETSAEVSRRSQSGADRAQPALGVLVVDDTLAIQRVLEIALTREGYEVYIASNLKEALMLFCLFGHQITIALLDVRMPGGDGPEVLRKLRVLRPELPAVFMSGELDPELTNSLADHLLAEGANGLIAKPMRLSDLVVVLTAAQTGQEPGRHILKQSPDLT